MQRALARIPDYEHALLDGRWHKNFDRERHTFIVDGDALVLSISAASLIAKVVRDRLMNKLAVKYPQYGWEHNRGYSTPDHLAALRLHGPTKHHRHRYRPVIQSSLFPLDDEPTILAPEDSPEAEIEVAAEAEAALKAAVAEALEA
jgi:ribonuclease HII